eukprot:5630463-Amphidinium_carterae.1
MAWATCMLSVGLFALTNNPFHGQRQLHKHVTIDELMCRTTSRLSFSKSWSIECSKRFNASAKTLRARIACVILPTAFTVPRKGISSPVARASKT